MEKRQFAGKNLEDALNQAARDFDTERENLGYTILPEAGGGLLKKLLFRTIRVEAWIEHTTDLQAAARQAVREAIDGDDRHHESRGRHDRNKNRKPRASDQKNAEPRERPSPTRERTPKPEGARRGPRQDDNKRPRRQDPTGVEDERTKGPSVTFGSDGIEDLLKNYTSVFLKVFDADLAQAQWSRSESGDMTVTVASPLLEDLLQRSDKLSSSFEHVFKRIVQKKYGDLAERLVLDAGEATAKRIENLQELARSLANKVKETGKSVTLNSRSGQERRVIHLTIDEIDGVATRSIGSGDGRKLVIYSTARNAARRHQPNRGKNQENRVDALSSSLEPSDGSQALGAGTGDTNKTQASDGGTSRRSRGGHRNRRGRGSGRGQAPGRTQGRAEGSY